MVQLPFFYSLTWHFWHFSRKQWDRANIIISVRQKVWHLSSNDAITNVVHRDLDLYSEGKNFWKYIILYIWKTARACEKWTCTTFITVEIRYRMAYVQFLGEMQRITFRLMLSSCVYVCLSVCVCVYATFVDLGKTAWDRDVVFVLYCVE